MIKLVSNELSIDKSLNRLSALRGLIVNCNFGYGHEYPSKKSFFYSVTVLTEQLEIKICYRATGIHSWPPGCFPDHTLRTTGFSCISHNVPNVSLFRSFQKVTGIMS